MNAAPPIDPEALRRMRAVITTAIGTRTRSIAEAEAEARGLGWGLQPALPASLIADAVTDILREVGAYLPAPDPVEHEGLHFRPVALEEVADTLAYAMRFDERGKARRTGQEYASKLAADQLVRQLLASGYVIMKPSSERPPPDRV